MRFAGSLNQIFGKKSKVKILRLLSLYKKEATIREISREINITPPNVSRILKELEKEGVITSKKVGRSILHSLNSRHYLVKHIILPAFKKEKEAKENLAKFLKRKLNSEIESIILFGSIAKQKEKPDSDIDLLFIVSDESNPKTLEEKISTLNPKITEYFGNSISPLIMKVSEFKLRLKKNDKLLKSILKEGEVLQGKSISEILCQKDF